MRTYHPGQKATRASEWRFYLVAQALLAGLLLWASGAQAVCVGATPCVNNTPLYIVSAAPPNVLMILSNAQNMDEAPDGQAAGANSPDSKSWQARDVIKTLVGNYSGQISLGLMSFKLNGTSNSGLYQSPYDASYNPSNWNPSYSGNRDSSTKRFCMPNPSNPGTCAPAANKLSGSCTGGNCIFYNVNLPFYGSNSGSDQLYCLSQSANFDNGSETYPSGPWDSYRCYGSKTGSSDFTANSWPSNAGTLGYSSLLRTYTFSPTDSDLAQTSWTSANNWLLFMQRPLTTSTRRRDRVRQRADQPAERYAGDGNQHQACLQYSGLSQSLADGIHQAGQYRGVHRLRTGQCGTDADRRFDHYSQELLHRQPDCWGRQDHGRRGYLQFTQLQRQWDFLRQELRDPADQRPAQCG